MDEIHTYFKSEQWKIVKKNKKIKKINDKIDWIKKKSHLAKYRTDKCVICFNNDPTFVIIDCTHLCVCRECSIKLAAKCGDDDLRCPMCRTMITDYVNFNIND